MGGHVGVYGWGGFPVGVAPCEVYVTMVGIWVRG